MFSPPPGRRGTGHVATLLGAAVNQAVWLARQATDGMILAAEPVRRLTGSFFELVARPTTAPEDAPPFGAYQVLGPRTDDSFRRRMPGVQAPLIGRTHELATLQESWRACRQGRGHIVSIMGEAGSGKSRLLLLRVPPGIQGAGDAHWLAAACPSSYHPGPYELIADLLRGLLGLTSSLDKPEASHQLRRGTAPRAARRPSGDGPDGRCRNPGRSPRRTRADDLPRSPVEPRARQHRIVSLLARLLARRTADLPVIVTVDDLHSADDASLDVLNQLVGAIERLPVLLVALFRSETSWQPPWWNRQGHRWLRLDSLPEDQGAALLAALLEPEVVPADLARAILERAGGNPFFLRELALAMRESGAASTPDRIQAVPPLPSTVQRLILTRMDALPQFTHRILSMTAVAGDQVEADVLQIALAETGDDAGLDEGMIQLEAKGFLYRRWDQASYHFTHAVVREVVYERISAEMRPRAHLCVGRALERVYAGREGEVLERLAHHFDRSADRLGALRYCLRAAQRAAETWANTIALSWYDRAQARVQSFTTEPPDEMERERGASQDHLLQWEVDTVEGQAGVQAAVGHTDNAIKGYGWALSLVEGSAIFPATRQADLYRKLAMALHDQGDLAGARAALGRGLSAAGDEPSLEAGRLYVWSGLLCFRRGELAEALASCQQGITILMQTDSPQDLAQAYNLQGLIYRNMGQSGPALAAHERSIALYAAAGDSAGLERATSNLGCVYQDLSRWPDALRHFERSAELTERTGEAWRRAAAAINLGEIYRRQGDLDRAIRAPTGVPRRSARSSASLRSQVWR